MIHDKQPGEIPCDLKDIRLVGLVRRNSRLLLPKKEEIAMQ